MTYYNYLTHCIICTWHNWCDLNISELSWESPPKGAMVSIGRPVSLPNEQVQEIFLSAQVVERSIFTKRHVQFRHNNDLCWWAHSTKFLWSHRLNIFKYMNTIMDHSKFDISSLFVQTSFKFRTKFVKTKY